MTINDKEYYAQEEANHHAAAAKASLTCVYPIKWYRRMYECDTDMSVYRSFVLSDVVAFEDATVKRMVAEHDAWHEEVEANRDPSQPRTN